MNSGISVAMTTCNGVKYLDEQLESIQRQTYHPCELVVGDDDSTDGTVDLLEKFADRASFPVRIIRNKPRLGVLKNFLHVFNHCQGQYIAYCDQDDVWHPGKLEKCGTALKEHNAVLVSHVSQVVDSQLHPTGKLIPYGFSIGCYAPPNFPFSYWSHGHQMVFRRELVGAINYFRQSPKRDILAHHQDNLDWLIHVLAGMFGDTVFLSEALIKFRRHSRTVSGCAKKVENKKDLGKKNKLEQKRHNLEEVVDILDAFQEYFVTIDSEGGLGLGLAHRHRYLDFLGEKKIALSGRLRIYAGTGVFERIKGFLWAIMYKAYGRPQSGGCGLRQAAIDLLVLVRLFPV